jgi:hypothetical protein
MTYVTYVTSIIIIHDYNLFSFHGEVHNPTQVVYGRIPGFISVKPVAQAMKLGNHLWVKTIRHLRKPTGTHRRQLLYS